MDKKTESTEALLREIAEGQRRDLLFGRISAAAIVVIAAAFLISLAVLVPRLTATLDHAHATLESTQKLVERIDGSLDELDALGERLNEYTSEENLENVNGLINALGEIDLGALTESIQKLNSVAEHLANFRLFG